MKRKKGTTVLKKEKVLTFEELVKERKKLAQAMQENDKKMHELFLKEINAIFSTLENQVQVELILERINEKETFLSVFEELKKIFIVGSLKTHQNTYVDVDGDLKRCLLDIWDKYSKIICDNY